MNLKRMVLLLGAVFLFTQACKEKSTSIEVEENPALQENTVSVTQEQFVKANIQLGKIEYKKISDILLVNGLLDVPPQNLISISVPMGGFLKNTELLQGMKVKKGQRIAIIENIDFISLQQEFLDTKSKLEFTTMELKRQQDLSAQNINSPRELQQIQSEFKSLSSKYYSLKQKLELIGLAPNTVSENHISKTVAIFSPINGYVTNIYTNVGRFVNPTDVLFDIVNTEHIHAELTVYEKDIAKIKKGQKVTFELANEENKIRSAKVFLIGREIGTDRTIRVHAHLDKEDLELLPKMYIKAKIEIENLQQMVLPNEAIVQDENQAFIFVSDSTSKDSVHVFTKILIKKMVSENGYTAISKNQKIDLKNLIIVKQGAFSLLSKMKNVEE